MTYPDTPAGVAELRKPCSIDGCEREVRARGWCSTHYNRWHRTGDLRANPYAARGAPLAWIEWVLQQETDECLLWPFRAERAGYGVLSVSGVLIGAHAEVCRRAHGEHPPERSEAAHACRRTRRCCNKRHLRWATHAENMADEAGRPQNRRKQL